jgi:hypothetical protein
VFVEFDAEGNPIGVEVISDHHRAVPAASANMLAAE